MRHRAAVAVHHRRDLRRGLVHAHGLPDDRRTLGIADVRAFTGESQGIFQHQRRCANEAKCHPTPSSIRVVQKWATSIPIRPTAAGR